MPNRVIDATSESSPPSGAGGATASMSRIGSRPQLRERRACGQLFHVVLVGAHPVPRREPFALWRKGFHVCWFTLGVRDEFTARTRRRDEGRK